MSKVALENKIQQLEEKLERKQDRLADVLNTRLVLKNENEALKAENEALLARSLKLDHVVRHIRASNKALSELDRLSNIQRIALNSVVSNDYLNDIR